MKCLWMAAICVASLVGQPAAAHVGTVTFAGNYQHQGTPGVLTNRLGDHGTWSVAVSYDSTTNTFGDNGVFSFGGLNTTLQSKPVIYDNGSGASVQFDLPEFDFSDDLQALCGSIGGCWYTGQSSMGGSSLGFDFFSSNPLKTHPNGFSSLSNAEIYSYSGQEAPIDYLFAYAPNDRYDALHDQDDLQFETTDLSFSVTAGVPEPTTWAMFILGFGVVGYSLRAAKRRSDEKSDAKIKRITSGAAA